ncbi:MAG: ABC transporter ATP-binding protein, partial [Lachnospiraceae bacterium]|nr:ABC transporter ATP-binding protein [Lachnospiraceae bacterium]
MGLTILFISHDLRVVAMMCHYVLVMKEGRVVEQGEVSQVFSAPQSSYTASLLEIARKKI